MLFAAVLYLMPVAAQARVAVVAVGDDVIKTGRLQLMLTQALESTKHEPIPTAELAVAIGVVEPPAVILWPANVKTEADQRLKAALAAYYKNDLDTATTHLREIERLHRDHQPVPPEDRVNLLFTQSAVLLARGEEDAARLHARSALVLVPDRVVDLDVYRPSFARLLDDVRESLKSVTVEVTGIPEGSSVLVDQRPVGTRFEIPVGTHELTIAAPGLKSARVTVQADDDRRLRATLPIALDRDTEGELRSLWDNKRIGPAQRERLDELAKKSKADVLVVAALSEESNAAHALVWWREPGRYARVRSATADARGAATLAKSIRTHLAKGPPAALAAFGDADSHFSVTAGVGVDSRTYQVSSGGDTAIDVQTVGAGPTLGARYSADFGLFADAGVYVFSHRMSTIDVRLPDGQGQVHGGDAYGVQAHLGYEKQLALKSTPFQLFAAGGWTLDAHLADDPADALGPLELLPRYQYSGLEILAGTGLSAGPVSFTGQLEWLPVASFVETPSRASGELTRASGLGWVLGVAYQPSEHTHLRASYAGRRRMAQLEGEASAPLEQPLTDAQVVAATQGLRLSFVYAF